MADIVPCNCVILDLYFESVHVGMPFVRRIN